MPFVAVQEKQTDIINSFSENEKEFFVDREVAREFFYSEYNQLLHNKVACSVIYYYGNGGIGKTSLLENISKEVNKNGYETFYYDFYNSPSIIDCLCSIRNSLRVSSYKFAFPRFDYSLLQYEKYFEKKFRFDENTSYDKIEKKLNKTTSIASFSAKVLGFKDLESALSAFNDLRAFCQNIYDLVIDEVTFAEIEQFKNTINETVSSKNAANVYGKLIKEILDAFQLDMNKAIQKMDTTYLPILIELDTFENIHFSKKDKHITGFELKSTLNEYDSTLLIGDDLGYIGLLEKIGGVIWVLAGRQKIEFKENGPYLSFNLEELPEKYVRELLYKKKINDEEIVNQIFETTKGFPAYIQLCSEIYSRKKGDVTKDDFIGNIQDLTSRFLRYISDDKEKKIVYFMATLKSWNDQFFYKLLDKAFGISSGEYKDIYDNIINSTFIRTFDKRKIFHEIIGEAIYNDKSYGPKEKEQNICLIINLFKELTIEDFKYFDYFISFIKERAATVESLVLAAKTFDETSFLENQKYEEYLEVLLSLDDRINSLIDVSDNDNLYIKQICSTYLVKAQKYRCCLDRYRDLYNCIKINKANFDNAFSLLFDVSTCFYNLDIDCFTYDQNLYDLVIEYKGYNCREYFVTKNAILVNHQNNTSSDDYKSFYLEAKSFLTNDDKLLLTIMNNYIGYANNHDEINDLQNEYYNKCLKIYGENSNIIKLSKLNSLNFEPRQEYIIKVYNEYLEEYGTKHYLTKKWLSIYYSQFLKYRIKRFTDLLNTSIISDYLNKRIKEENLSAINEELLESFNDYLLFDKRMLSNVIDAFFVYLNNNDALAFLATLYRHKRGKNLALFNLMYQVVKLNKNIDEIYYIYKLIFMIIKNCELNETEEFNNFVSSLKTLCNTNEELDYIDSLVKLLN